MSPRLVAVATAVTRPFLRWWDRVPLKLKGIVTIGLPVLAVVVSAVLAVSGNQERARIETDIQRTFEISAALGELSSSMVNAETGMRGYLLTGQNAFLEPFDQARRDLPAALSGLDALVGAESARDARPDLVARLQALRDLTGRQMDDLAQQPALAPSPGAGAVRPELRAHLEYGKGLMDRIRAEVGDLQAAERTTLDARVAEINAIRVRDYVSVVAVLVVALATRFLAWYLFRRGVLGRVERLTATVRDLRAGAGPPPPRPVKNDHLGLLEQEVARLAAGPVAATSDDREGTSPPVGGCK